MAVWGLMAGPLNNDSDFKGDAGIIAPWIMYVYIYVRTVMAERLNMYTMPVCR